MILDRQRTIGETLAEALAVYVRDWRVYLALAALVIVPADLLVVGVSLGELTASTEDYASSTGNQLVSIALAVVTGTLVMAMVLSALRERCAGGEPAIRAAARAGLDVFAVALAAAALVFAGVVVGLFALVVPGLVLGVKWAVTVPGVVLEGRRPLDATERSWRLTAGAFWHTAGTVLAATLVSIVAPAAIVGLPAAALAQATDAYGIVFGASVLLNVLTAPFLALVVGLLFGDLRARREAADQAAADAGSTPGAPGA